MGGGLQKLLNFCSHHSWPLVLPPRAGGSQKGTGSPPHIDDSPCIQKLRSAWGPSFSLHCHGSIRYGSDSRLILAMEKNMSTRIRTSLACFSKVGIFSLLAQILYSWDIRQRSDRHGLHSQANVTISTEHCIIFQLKMQTECLNDLFSMKVAAVLDESLKATGKQHAVREWRG